MGATQSKKRRKEKHKKKRLSLDISGSISEDGLHSVRLSSSYSSSNCPPCPHCRQSLEWSSDHSFTHLCLHHARQHASGESSNTEDEESATKHRRIGKISASDNGSEAAVLSSSSQECLSLRLCEISNQDFDKEAEFCTMSLNRHMDGRNSSVERLPKSALSKRLDTSVTSRQSQEYRFTKENVNPTLMLDENQQPSMLGKKMRGVSNQILTSRTKRNSELHRSNDTNRIATSVPSQMKQSLSENIIHSNVSGNKVTKNSSNLFDDETAILSQREKRKQMAQELRKLRLHLQQAENIGLSVPPHISLDSFNNDTVVKGSSDDLILSPQIQQENNIFTRDICAIVSKESSVNSNIDTTAIDITDSTFTSNNCSSPTRRSLRSKFSRLRNYRFLDSHPVMTRLQNEQNNRLELMERRMEEIRQSAMQEAERKRFAEIFPAKNNDSETQKLLREARESLERMKEEKRKKTSESQLEKQRVTNQCRANSEPPMSIRSSTEEDILRSSDEHGEIVPVTVLSSYSSRESTPVANDQNQKKVVTTKEKSKPNGKKNIWAIVNWPNINLGNPVTWLWLPFLLFPLVLRMLLSIVINSFNSNNVAATHGGNGINTRHEDCSLPSTRRKKSH